MISASHSPTCPNFLIFFLLLYYLTSFTAQLLQKLNIKARGKGEKLLRLVENPVTKHLPLNSHIIGETLNMFISILSGTI